MDLQNSQVQTIHPALRASLSPSISPNRFYPALWNILSTPHRLRARSLLFDSRFRNDETGATAYNLRIIHKIVIYAGSLGSVYRRKIEQLSGE